MFQILRYGVMRRDRLNFQNQRGVMKVENVVIVGGGVSGLIAGARLAQQGIKVTVFEKSEKIGGRAVGAIREGFALDFGMHVVRNGARGFMSVTLEKLGIDFPMASIGHPEFYFLKDGALAPFPQTHDVMMASDMLTMDEKMKILSVLTEGVYEKYKDKTMREWIDSVGGGEALANFTRILSCSVVCPFVDRASAGEVFESLRRRILMGNHPAALPIGGYFKILDALADYIRAHGGAVKTGMPVREVKISGGRAAGIETDSGAQPADAVVCAFPYKNLFKILDPNLVDPAVRKKLSSLVPTSGLCIDYALDAPVSDFKSIAITLEEPFVYAIITSNIDPTVAPEGKQLISFNMLNNIEDLEDPALAGKLMEKLERTAFEFWPEIPNKMLWKRELKLKVVNSAQVNFLQHRDARPGPKETGVPGLYLAGDALNTLGGGGDLAVTSANLCTDAIFADMGD
jgi:phytoene dehydrogenase-like protein